MACGYCVLVVCLFCRPFVISHLVLNQHLPRFKISAKGFKALLVYSRCTLARVPQLADKWPGKFHA